MIFLHIWKKVLIKTLFYKGILLEKLYRYDEALKNYNDYLSRYP